MKHPASQFAVKIFPGESLSEGGMEKLMEALNDAELESEITDFVSSKLASFLPASDEVEFFQVTVEEE